MSAPVLKNVLLGLLLAANTVSQAQTLPNPASVTPTETAAAWLSRVQQLPHSAQVTALRARLLADARRTFRNDPSQMPVCLMGVSAANRAAWEAARRIAPDTVVHDDRVLCIVNGAPLDGPEAARTLVSVPARAIRQIQFLIGLPAQAVYGTRAGAGVVLVKVAK